MAGSTHTGFVRNRVRAWFDGAGWLVGIAVALLFFTMLTVLAELQSSDVVLWTGQGVVGREQGGIISYQWKGQSYTINGQGYGSSPAVTVYLDPANPGNAMPDSALGRAMDASLIVGPFGAAMVLLALGPARNYRRARRRRRGIAPPAGYGHGLEEEFVSRVLAQRRRRPQ